MKTKSFVLAACIAGLLGNEAFAQVDTSGRKDKDTTGRQDTSENRRDTSGRRDSLNSEARIHAEQEYKVAAADAVINQTAGSNHSSNPVLPNSLVISREILAKYTNREVAGDELPV